MSWAALYDGVCSRCEERIRVGQLIDRDGDGGKFRREFHHVTCPDPAPTPVDMAPGETVCPRCFTVHAGECL
jgi:hypothetical protein